MLKGVSVDIATRSLSPAESKLIHGGNVYVRLTFVAIHDSDQHDSRRQTTHTVRPPR